MSKKKSVPRNPFVVEAKFRKSGLMEKTKKEKNKENRALTKKETDVLMKNITKHSLGWKELKEGE